jgi:hypothetical protein
MEHLFPLQNPPTCHICRKPCIRFNVKEGSRTGNARRPYWTCLKHSPSKFSCFDDTEGIYPENPQCLCRITSRRTKGKYGDFFSCAIGGCKWTTSALGPPVSSSYPAHGTPPVQPYPPSQSTTTASGSFYDRDSETSGGHSVVYSMPTPPVTPSRPTVAFNGGSATRHIRTGSGYQAPVSTSVSPRARATSDVATDENSHGSGVGVYFGYQTPQSTPLPSEAPTRRTTATSPEPPTSPSRSTVVTNDNLTDIYASMGRGYERSPPTTTLPQAVSRPAPVATANGNLSRDARADQTPYSAPTSPQATNRPAPPALSNGNPHGRGGDGHSHPYPSIVSVSPAWRIASMGAVNGDLASGNTGTDSGYQTLHSIHEPPVESSGPAVTNGSQPGGNIGRDYYGYQKSPGISMRPAAPSRSTNGDIADKYAETRLGYSRYRGGCCSPWLWLCGCCGCCGLF